MTRAPYLLVAVLLIGCKSAGTSPETRADIMARMKTAEAPIQACYANVLKDNRRVRGMLSLRLVAEADSGQFKNLTVLRDEPNDTALRQCVLAEIGKLKLEKPTKTQVQIDQAIRFSPNN